MEIRNFVLSFYPNTADGIHIQRVEKPREAREFHTHDYYQIYYIAKGSLTHFVGADAVRLSRGEMFLIPPGVMHRIREDADIVFYSLSFTPQVLEEISRSAGFAADFLRSLGSDPKPRVFIPGDQVLSVETLMEQLLREFEARQVAGSEMVKLYVGLLLSMFSRFCLDADASLPLPGQEDKKRFLLYCVDYIDHNFFRKITLDSIVKRAAVSRSEFCKGFRELTGHSFRDYVTMCRIRDAARRIRDGEKITVVCTLCGYQEFSTFYRNFKKHTGLSPAQFAKLHRQKTP